MRSIDPSIHSILLIRLSSLGDVLLCTPVVRALRRTYPQVRIDVAVAAEFADVWRMNPYVDNVIEIDKSKSAFASLNKRRLTSAASSYGIVLDLQRNIRSYVLRRAFGSRALLVDKHRSEKVALVHSKTYPARIHHIVDRLFETVNSIGVSNDGDGLELWLEEDKRAGVYLRGLTNQLTSSHQPRIVLAPGARHNTKRWPADRFSQLAEALVRTYDAEVVLVGGASDKELCAAIVSQCKVPLSDASGSSLFETAGLMDGAGLVVSNDSGAMHVAAARRVPVVVLYGSTVPAFGFAPYGTVSTIVEKEVGCRPCTHIGRASCPEGHFHCMNLITVQDVLEASLGLNIP